MKTLMRKSGVIEQTAVTAEVALKISRWDFSAETRIPKSKRAASSRPNANWLWMSIVIALMLAVEPSTAIPMISVRPLPITHYQPTSTKKPVAYPHKVLRRPAHLRKVS